MKQLASEKLKKLGIDIEFLAWLEGEEPRVPDLNRIRKVRDADFAAAIRATEWLGQHFTSPELISPQRPEEWNSRYEVLQQFLYAALGSSLFYHPLSVPEDLEALERVLKTLLPSDFWDEYRQDIHLLRQKGLPLRLKMKAKATGGRGTSEQTMRMQAAVALISAASKTPYSDLATFWNERLGTNKYQADPIKDRLRKGDDWSRRAGAAQRSLEYWRRIYDGDLLAVFPGLFPLSPNLRASRQKVDKALPRKEP